MVLRHLLEQLRQDSPEAERSAQEEGDLSLGPKAACRSEFRLHSPWTPWRHLLLLSNKEIASKLAISDRTVKFHVSNLLTKFGVERRQHLISRCLQVPPGGPPTF
ncbi:MAG TPA: LuxR C-terminal-related transcriptional regulator [Vicinamibacteria bacterium]|nr:LuxR C-terminal-related transcriptional regulator [Vicinamibacteria bacterium]